MKIIRRGNTPQYSLHEPQTFHSSTVKLSSQLCTLVYSGSNEERVPEYLVPHSPRALGARTLATQTFRMAGVCILPIQTFRVSGVWILSGSAQTLRGFSRTKSSRFLREIRRN